MILYYINRSQFFSNFYNIFKEFCIKEIFKNSENYEITETFPNILVNVLNNLQIS